MDIINIDYIKKEFEEMKKNPPKQKSKKETIAEYAMEIRALIELGYSYREILDELKNGGLNLRESTLKNYLSKASVSPGLRPGSTEAGTPLPRSNSKTRNKQKKPSPPYPHFPVEENELSTSSDNSPSLPDEKNMVHSDLLLHLVRSVLYDDKDMFVKTVEIIAANERAQQHTFLAEQLENLLNAAPQHFSPTSFNEPNPPESPGLSGNKGSVSDPCSNTFFYEKNPQKQLADLIFSPDVLQLIEKIIQEQQEINLLRSYGVEPRNKIMLLGDPGNGKTALAEAIAEALSAPLFVVQYGSLVGTHINETTNRIKKIFESVSNHRCVLFFDKFENLEKELDIFHNKKEINKAIDFLLTQIEELPKHVLVIGATNSFDTLNKTIYQYFQLNIALPHPTRDNRIKWFEKFEKRINKPFGYPPEKIAEYFCTFNFAGLEEFGAAIFRELVLSQQKVDIKVLISQAIESLRNKNIIPWDLPDLEKP